MQVLCLAACLAQCGLLLGSACSTLHTVRTARALQEIYRTAAPETADPLAPLKALNPDCAAWLEVDGTAVNLPVVLPEDNRTYLERDFSGEPSRSGTLFFDFRTDASTENPVIYGHNMRDGSMFGELGRFGEESFFTEHGLIRLTASEGVMWYRIFAAAVIPAWRRSGAGVMPTGAFTTSPRCRRTAWPPSGRLWTTATELSWTSIF